MIQKVLSIFIFIGIYCCSCQQLFALGEPLFLAQLGKQQGLSQVSVIDILQSRDGYIWIATQDGLNRYDGYEFKVFRHDNKDPNSISDNYIWSLVEDEHGHIWVGTRGGGLNKFDPKTEKFINFKAELKFKLFL